MKKALTGPVGLSSLRVGELPAEADRGLRPGNYFQLLFWGSSHVPQMWIDLNSSKSTIPKPLTACSVQLRFWIGVLHSFVLKIVTGNGLSCLVI